MELDPIEEMTAQPEHARGNGHANGHAAPKPYRVPPMWWHGDPVDDASNAWLVEGLLPAIGVALLSGQWGLYKSFTAIDLAVAVMTGDTFAGRPVAGRHGVLYVAREGGNKLPDRLEAAYDRRGGGGRLPFVRITECPALVARDAAAQFDAILREANARMEEEWGVGVGLVIIDTMSAAGGFREETNAEAQAAMDTLARLAREHGCLVLAVDHFGKVVENGTRGASAKEAAADVVLAMLGERSTAGTVTNCRMAVRKCRDNGSGIEIPFAVRTTAVAGGERTTLVIDWTGPAGPAAPRPARVPAGLRLFMDAVVEAVDGYGAANRPFHDGPVVQAVDIVYARSKFYQRYPADGDTETKRNEARKKAFRRALDAALERRLVATISTGETALIWLAGAANDNHFCASRLGDGQIQAPTG